MRAQEFLYESSQYVTRIDSQQIPDFYKNMQTYYHTDDFSQSGQFAPGAKIPKKYTGKITGVYAGDPLFTALYATGNANQTRYVAKYGPGQPIVYFDRKDIPAMRARRTYLTVFDASRFKKLPTGEYFSDNPGQPVKQEAITDPFQYIKNQGWEFKIVDDLPAVLKKLQAQKVRYGAEGMDSLNEVNNPDKLTESVDIRQEIIKAVKQQGGRPDEYFVRYTDQDKLGYSSQQHFGRTPDVGDADYDPDALPRPRGRPALWFYPLKTFLQNTDIYASNQPYVWLVRLKPEAWLQKVDHKTQQQQPAPEGKQRVGMLTSTSGLPTAVFFKPGFEVVDRWYDYGKMHKRRAK